MNNWREVVVSPDTPLAETIRRMDASRLQIALVVDQADRLVGVVTDGDIRRGILRGITLATLTAEVMSPRPLSLSAGASRQEVLAFMRSHMVQQVPLLDERGTLVGLDLLNNLLTGFERPNWVVLMAGGLGMRLRPLTESCPKPLLTVGGKAILETILESFVEQGFRRFYVAVNYRAEMIRSFFGNGERWGVRIDYLHEDRPLGTAGALSLLPEQPAHPLITMNGDLLTRPNYAGLLDFHEEHGATATMAVREYDFQVPYGVVKLDDAVIAAIEEKPVQRFFVNAGIYVLSPAALKLIPSGTPYDMPTLFQQLTRDKLRTVAYPLREYWLDIGRTEEFERAQREWTSQGGEQDKP